MKPARLWKTVAFLAMSFAPRGAVGQDDLATLLGRLAGKGLDHSALIALEGHPPDPRIIPGLEAAFGGREAKDEKQWIAVALLRLGDKSEKYFDFLAGFVRVAVEDRAPFPVEKRGEFTAEFQNWCANNGKDPQTAASQVAAYTRDGHFLAMGQDPRATDLFRRGLESPNVTVVAFCVEGLARLQDVAAIPLIAKAADRFPPGAWRAIAMQLPWFGRLEAYQLMERLEPDRRSREFQIDQVERTRLAEANRVLSRTGGAPAQ